MHGSNSFTLRIAYYTISYSTISVKVYIYDIVFEILSRPTLSQLIMTSWTIMITWDSSVQLRSRFWTASRWFREDKALRLSWLFCALILKPSLNVRRNVTVQMTSPSWFAEDWKNSPCLALHQSSKFCKLHHQLSQTRLLETAIGIQMNKSVLWQVVFKDSLVMETGK